MLQRAFFLFSNNGRIKWRMRIVKDPSFTPKIFCFRAISCTNRHYWIYLRDLNQWSHESWASDSFSVFTLNIEHKNIQCFVYFMFAAPTFIVPWIVSFSFTCTRMKNFSYFHFHQLAEFSYCCVKLQMETSNIVMNFTISFHIPRIHNESNVVHR